MRKSLTEPAPHYVVEAILRSKGKGRTRRYLVKWVGYSVEESTWEPPAHLHPQLIAEWEEDVLAGGSSGGGIGGVLGGGFSQSRLQLVASPGGGSAVSLRTRPPAA